MRRCHRAPRSAALIAVAMLSLSSCTSTERRGAIGAEGDGRVEVGYPAPGLRDRLARRRLGVSRCPTREGGATQRLGHVVSPVPN